MSFGFETDYTMLLCYAIMSNSELGLKFPYLPGNCNFMQLMSAVVPFALKLAIIFDLR